MISNIGEGATPLMYACQQSREREVLDIIARKRNAVRERDRTLKTPLHYCTENASNGCAEAVLRAAPELLDAKDEDGYTALHLAVIAGNRTFLRFLISRGANVNALDNEKHSAVHWATVCAEEEALEIILRAGANISTADIHGGYPLHYAAQMCGPGCDIGRDSKTSLRILSILLSHDIDINVMDKDGRQPLLWAASADAQSRDPGARFASSGSADAILALVKAGASVEASDKDGLTALHCAASRGHTDCIETLITLCGAHIDVIDSNGCTALFYAVTLGHADATQLLLSLGAEPNRQDRKGRSPAHCGAAKGQLETLRILLNYGANLWLRNVKGDFPLHEAIASGRKDLVRWLLNQRADSINVGNNDGRCPVHIAAINNNIDMIKILLDAQSLVNPIMRTTKGNMMTPLDAALYRGFRGCAKYLQLHGGVPFTKLTEKSSNIRGISSRQITSDMYMDNYGERLELSSWGAPPNSSTLLPSSIASQVRMGGDAAIQQIETTEFREVNRIRDKYEDVESSDEDKVLRRRRRRKKWEHQEKGYSNEEDVDFDDQLQDVEQLKRRQRSIRSSGMQKKREQYDESSSESDYYKRKSMRKKDSNSDNEERRIKYYERKKHRSESEDNRSETKRDKKRISRRENSHKARSKIDDTGHEKAIIILSDNECPEITKQHEKLGNVSAADPIQVAITEIISYANDGKTENEESALTNEPEIGQIDQQVTVAEGIPVASEIEPVVTENIQEINSEENKLVEAAEETTEPEKYNVETQEKVDEPIKEKVEEIVFAENSENVNKENSSDVNENKNDQNANDAVEEVIEKVIVTEIEAPTEAVLEETIGAIVDGFSEEKEGDKEINDSAFEVPENDEVEKKTETIEPMTAEEKNYVYNDNNHDEENVRNNSNHEEEEDDGNNDEDDVEEKSVINDNEKGEEEKYDNKNEEDDKQDNTFEPSMSKVLNGTFYLEQNHEETLDQGSFKKSSDIGAKDFQMEGSVEDESEGSTRNEDSSMLLDSGIEPSPRRKNNEGGGLVGSRVPRLCHKVKDPEEIHSVSVTQTVQNTIRKYHMERRIFYQLLELKRLQIRAGRANEQILVKRLVDEYRRGGIIPGLKNYTGQYSFRQFEKFLYDQLRTLQSTAHILIPKLRPSDDIETLSTILRKSRIELVDDIPENPIFCTQGTHRCHHAAHAYTGIPCAAYINRFNHHEMPKTRSTGFLPQIDQDKQIGQQTYRPVTLELTHGKEKQVISLPTDRLDKNKRYYVTFTIKGGPSVEDSKSAGYEKKMPRRKHAKSF